MNIIGIDWITFGEFAAVGIFSFIMGVHAEKGRQRNTQSNLQEEKQ